MRFLFFKNPAKKNGILLLETEGACLCRPISWSMAAMLGNSAVAVAVVVVVVRTRPRAIPLAMKTMRKFLHGFPFLSHMNMGLRYKKSKASHNHNLLKSRVWFQTKLHSTQFNYHYLFLLIYQMNQKPVSENKFWVIRVLLQSLDYALTLACV